MRLLELEDVHTYIGQHHILQGVSLRVRPDAVTVLLGRNGAGKTTTMRTHHGLLRPRRGAVRFEGRPIHRLPPHAVARLGIGYVPEGQGIFATLTVDENLRVAMLAEDAESRERLRRVLALFPDLERFRHARAGTLSGGQKQMLAIARAFVNPTRLLLIDEPSKGLAPIVVEHLIAALRAMKQRDHRAAGRAELRHGRAAWATTSTSWTTGAPCTRGRWPPSPLTRRSSRGISGYEARGARRRCSSWPWLLLPLLGIEPRA